VQYVETDRGGIYICLCRTQTLLYRFLRKDDGLIQQLIYIFLQAYYLNLGTQGYTEEGLCNTVKTLRLHSVTF